MLGSNPSKQEVFDHIISSIRKQKVASIETKPDVRGATICAYRGENGLKCVVGHCISDEEYSPRMEGKNIESIVSLYDLPESLHWMKEFTMLEFLARMQDHHDHTLRYSGLEAWEQGMARAAKEYELDYNPQQRSSK